MSDTSKNEAKSPPSKKKSKKILFFILIIIIAAGGYFGYKWWTDWRFFVSTDDAYVQGDIASIAPKVSGYIVDIPITANQAVKQGDIIFRLDDGDYQIALEEAKAKIITLQHTIDRIDAQITAAKTTLLDATAQKNAADAVALNATNSLERATKLNKESFVAQSEVENAQSSYDQATANVARAAAQIATANANIAVLEAQKNESLSQNLSLQLAQQQAERNLEYTILRAPFDGVIGNLSAKMGDFVGNGQRLAALVPMQALYIDANYKETQLAEIYQGEKARITIDGIEGQIFEGEVLSLSPASGSVFSLLPPQNATGNFTKIVQRVPVRVSLPKEALATGRIRAGMSVLVEIDIRTKPDNAHSIIEK